MNTYEWHEYLLMLDQRHSVSAEMPVDFPYRERMNAVRKLCELIKRETANQCVLDDQVQDAYFFAEILLSSQAEQPGASGIQMAIRFSSFGSMAAVEIPESAAESRDSEERVESILTTHGFVPVRAQWLQSTKYDGGHPYFHEHKLTWWDRFFEYT